MSDWMLPGLLLMSGALPACLMRGRIRDVLLLLAPLAALALIWNFPLHTVVRTDFMGYAVEPLHITALGRLFATTFAVMAFGGMLFALKQASATELAAAAVYAGGAVGVSLSGDFITLFVFWELMTIASTVIVFAGATPSAGRAGFRYAMMHVLCGIVMLCGIVGLVTDTGDALLRPLTLDSLYTWMILIGFLISAGAPPVSAWVADAYPEASPSGTVFLSAFTTKTAVFALLALFAGTPVLIPIGLYMIIYGIIYALLENDMRRILAYSIINQVGFMVTGAGIGTELAVNAAAAHASAHIIYKGLLMMSAGSVLLITARRKCSELGGLYSSMRVTTLCGIIGAVSISAFPLTSGFVSKALIGEAAIMSVIMSVWLVLTAAAAGVFLHAGIKFPWFVFFNKKTSDLNAHDPPPNMQLAMLLFALLCLAPGFAPELFYALLPHPVDYTPYTLKNVVSQLQLLLFSGVVFFMMLPLMQRTPTISLDFDWFYRRLPVFLFKFLRPAVNAARAALKMFRSHGAAASAVLLRPCRPDGVLAKTIPSAGLVIVVVAMLVAFLLLYY